MHTLSPATSSSQAYDLRAAQAALGGSAAATRGQAGVLDVRLGWLFRDGWITDQRAWVVTVPQKLTPAELHAAGRAPLPDEFQGLPVDVTGPTVEDLLRMVRGPELAEPAAERAAAALAIRYTPPQGVTLRPVTGKMRVVAHVSPDAGWRELAAFLTGTRRRLVVGMYDCGAPHIVEALQAAGQRPGFHKLTLVMQHGASVGAGTKSADLKDEAVVEKLDITLKDKFEHAWAQIGLTNGWVATSYHIKVAVRDDAAFWLSSGNWQSSNQPLADPLGEEPQRRKWLTDYNRDWHAVVEHAGLARRLSAYLQNDFRNNLAVRGLPGEADLYAGLPELLAPELSAELAPLDVAAAWRYFPPYDETRVFTVRPLLTPDNYHRYVLEMVQAAREELLIQNQTFNAPLPGQTALRALVDAVIAAQRRGVAVRIIFRLLDAASARQTLERLKDYGLDLSSVKLQGNCHTKGIIVDRRQVLIGSQNWSNYGVSFNRDASLLFDDAALARYFAEIFDHDWHHLAGRKIGSEWLQVRLAGGERALDGMAPLSWKAYQEMR